MKRRNNTLRKSLALLMSGSALAVASTCASAVTIINLGTVPNSGRFTSSTVPQYAWDGWNGISPNLGWAHNAKWYTFTLSAQTTVQITMTSTDAGMNPAFSVWQTTGTFVGSNHENHAFNQVSLGGTSSFLRPQPPGTDGTKAFIGYVNAGNSFTNGDGQAVGAGSAGMSRKAAGYAAFARTLAKGQYLIAAGGSCQNARCGTPSLKAYKLNIQKLPLANSGKSP